MSVARATAWMNTLVAQASGGEDFLGKRGLDDKLSHSGAGQAPPSLVKGYAVSE